MGADDLDRILANEPDIVPSSGFVSSVMEAVKHEAEAPPAIPFPWKRALPGMAGAVAALGWAFLVAVNILGGAAAAHSGSEAMPPAIASLIETLKITGAGWFALALALVLSLGSVKLASRLAA